MPHRPPTASAPLLCALLAVATLFVAGCQQSSRPPAPAAQPAFVPAAHPFRPTRTPGVIQAIETTSVDRQVVLFQENEGGAVRRITIIALPEEDRRRMIGMRMVFVDTVGDMLQQLGLGNRQVVRIFDDAFQFDIEYTGQSADRSP